jgi:hypothetical protein
MYKTLYSIQGVEIVLSTDSAKLYHRDYFDGNTMHEFLADGAFKNVVEMYKGKNGCHEVKGKYGLPPDSETRMEELKNHRLLLFGMYVGGENPKFKIIEMKIRWKNPINRREADLPLKS